MVLAKVVPAAFAALFGICTVILVLSLLVQDPTIDRLSDVALYLVLLLVPLFILWLVLRGRSSGAGAA